MEFLVQFELDIPDGVADSEVEGRERAETAAAETLADEGHLVRVWQTSDGTGRTTVLGLYRAYVANVAQSHSLTAQTRVDADRAPI